jgi:hypothetical protein
VGILGSAGASYLNDGQSEKFYSSARCPQCLLMASRSDLTLTPSLLDSGLKSVMSAVPAGIVYFLYP